MSFPRRLSLVSWSYVALLWVVVWKWMNMCKQIWLWLVSIVYFLQNSLLQSLVLSNKLASCLILWVPSIQLHSTCTVEVGGDIRHLIHFNLHLKVLELAYRLLGASWEVKVMIVYWLVTPIGRVASMFVSSGLQQGALQNVRQPVWSRSSCWSDWWSRPATTLVLSIRMWSVASTFVSA